MDFITEKTVETLLGTKIMMALLVGGVLAIGGYVVFKGLKKVEEKTEQEFKASIQSTVVSWLSNQLNAPSEQIRPALEQWINGEQQEPILASVLRIECEITRNRTDCPVKITMALEKNGELIMGEIEQKTSWENLPKDIRAKFIRFGKPTQVYVIAERK
jgi:hypothetical protein